MPKVWRIVSAAQYTDEDLSATVRAELGELGLIAERIFVYCSAGPYWSFRVEVAGRSFKAGINYREGLFCWDITPGNEKNLIPPAIAPVFGDLVHLRRGALRLVKHALRHPEYAFGDPPVL